MTEPSLGVIVGRRGMAHRWSLLCRLGNIAIFKSNLLGSLIRLADNEPYISLKL